MTEPVFTILMGGPLTATARLLERLKGTRIIAADGGTRDWAALGQPPKA